MRILEVNKVYKHYKTNDLYTIVSIDYEGNTVTYRRVNGTMLYIRNYDEFNEYFSDKNINRFEEVKNGNS
jgi:hypothetical protein